MPDPTRRGSSLIGLGERFEVGFLEMQTRELSAPDGSSLFAAENFAVGRVKAHLSGGSSIGAMLVSRQETGTGAVPAAYNRAYGVDGTFNLFQNLVLSAYVAGTSERTPLGDRTSAAGKFCGQPYRTTSGKAAMLCTKQIRTEVEAKAERLLHRVDSLRRTALLAGDLL